MNIVYWVVFGLIVGVVTQLADPQPKSWILRSMILGIFGAVAGGFTGNFIFGVGITGFNISSLSISVLGALLLLSLSRLVQSEERETTIS